jgi:2-hydroxycyclohexanecarboxyl-CoA dehydrogenase
VEALKEGEALHGKDRPTVSRVAVVTGGGSGMGRAICLQLADAGRRVAVLDINAGAAVEVAGDITSFGGTACAAVVDVSDRTAVETALDEARSALGPIEIMVTSAGIEGFTEFLDITPEAWDRMMAVNLTGTFHCLQAAVPDMIEAGWGRIVTISSSSAQSGTRRMSHYVASKGGVIAFTKALALDLAPNGITVNTIPPGVIDTPMMRRPIDAGTMNVDAVIARAPLGRLGTPEDIAAACVFLCSEEAGYITGQQINVNGGWYV